MTLAWIDVENPPQVQYLLPFRDAFAAAGVDVVVTARDYGITYELLRGRGIPFTPVGASYGKGKWHKVQGLGRRALALERRLRAHGRPDLLISASRSAALAARRLGTTSFALSDYEHADTAVFRLARSYMLFPDVIAPAAFSGQGVAERRLLPFPGLKEDLSFAGVELDAIKPYVAPGAAAGCVAVLFRPAAEESHYYSRASGDLALELLGRLACDERAQLVYSPRYPHQVSYLARFEWRRAPVVLEHAVPFVSLLKGADLVVSSGGTMLREAAYLGIPAVSIFQSEIGAVDRHLEAIGRLTFVRSAADFDAFALEPRPGGVATLERTPDLAGRLVATMLAKVGARGAVAQRAAA